MAAFSILRSRNQAAAADDTITFLQPYPGFEVHNPELAGGANIAVGVRSPLAAPFTAITDDGVDLVPPGDTVPFRRLIDGNIVIDIISAAASGYSIRSITGFDV